MITYTVNADHPSPEFRAQNLEVIVRRDRDGYWATAVGYGTSKTRATPEICIREFLASHGCYNIRIVAKSPKMGVW